MTKKPTKRALFSSMMALVLCFAMLLGTTYAWLTDAVTVTNNIITAGNLDVEVYYAPVADEKGVVYTEITDAMWTKVEADSQLFKKDALWEPGHAEAVYLKIVNEGTLAFKYTLDVEAASETIGTSVLGNDIKLSDILMVDMHQNLGSQILYTGRTEGADAVTIDEFYQDWGAFIPNMQPLHKALAELGTDERELLKSGETMYVQLGVYMPTTVGNEANYRGGKIPQINLGITVLATQTPYEEDTFGPNYDKDAVYPVADIREFQAALDEAGDGDVIQFSSDFAGDVTLPQKKDVNVVIDGNGHKFSGSLLVDGKSATYTGAGLTIKNVNFSADTISTDACIQLGNGTNATRYTCNVTIEGCTFDVPGVVGVKSYTGGDKNVTIKDCVATERAHSLAQLKGVDGVVVENCTVNSVRGINLNNSNNVKIVDSTFDVEKYAVRFGESANSVQEVFEITNCTLTSDNVDGDAVIVLRAGATDATLTLTNTTLNGAIQMTGRENATIIVR